MSNEWPGRCCYCERPAAYNKQGQWGHACSGCKASLTKMLRSGKYGPTYDKATKARLCQARYDWDSHKWVVPNMAAARLAETQAALV